MSQKSLKEGKVSVSIKGGQCVLVLFPGVLEYLRYVTRIGDEGYNTHPLPALGVDQGIGFEDPPETFLPD